MQVHKHCNLICCILIHFPWITIRKSRFIIPRSRDKKTMRKYPKLTITFLNALRELEKVLCYIHFKVLCCLEICQIVKHAIYSKIPTLNKTQIYDAEVWRIYHARTINILLSIQQHFHHFFHSNQNFDKEKFDVSFDTIQRQWEARCVVWYYFWITLVFRWFPENRRKLIDSLKNRPILCKKVRQFDWLMQHLVVSVNQSKKSKIS